ncbi:MAG: hypothetical protein RMA76_23150 [Deltaproteobacteria bacterium]|jgi:hypothetical protein
MRWLLLLLVALSFACEGKLDKERFRRRAEKAYIEVNSGWTIIKRDLHETIFVRGDQVDTLDVQTMFEDYEKSGQKGSDYFEAWMAERKAEAEARRRTLEQAKSEVIPIIKSEKWIRVQDLGAIGPERIRDQIRPWRQEVAPDVFAVLGIPEEKLGYRFASIEEVKASKVSDDAWMKIGMENVRRIVGEPTGQEMRMEDKLKVFDLKNVDGVSALLLDPRFRANMLEKFSLSELGAAVPIRNVLIVFDPADFTTIKPIRARARQLYDSQNHPGFRGLLRFDKNVVTVLDSGEDKKK